MSKQTKISLQTPKTVSTRAGANSQANVDANVEQEEREASPLQQRSERGRTAQREPRDSRSTTTMPAVSQESATTEYERLTELILARSDALDRKLEIIGETTKATEGKLTEIANRITRVERRVDFLETSVEEIRSLPAPDAAATALELEALQQKMDDLENRERRNNLRFVGFPADCEEGDAIQFLCDVLPAILKMEFPRPLELERAHRVGPVPTVRNGEGDARPSPVGRTIIARFLRFQDRERVANAARKLGSVTWNNHPIMVFADYSKLVNEKRKKFKDCKKALHEKNVRFSLEYPAVLAIRTQRGVRRYDDSARAMEFIRSLG